MQQNLGGIDQASEVNAQLLNIPRRLSNKQITQILINEWRNSSVIEDMVTANEYYLCRNTTIAQKQRTYMDQAGMVHVNESLSNQQIPSAFLRSSVNQKINYAFGKPFVINVESKEKSKKEQQQDSIAEEYLQAWQDYVDTHFRKFLKRIAKNSVNNGIGWGYVWIDDIGKLRIMDVDSETLYPQWADRAHTALDAIVRDFEVVEFEDTEPIKVQKVEYWDSKVVERFIDQTGELVVDVEAEGTAELPLATAHMEMGGQAVAWGKVPFISLKSNEDELPLLNLIRSLIDAYDLLTSKSVDSLDDDIDPIVVMKNISAEIGGLIKARELLKNSRIAAIDGDGDAYYLQVKADITAIQTKLEHLRKDIREFSCSVDTQDIKFGSNPSGIALKAMYQDLDIYVNGLEVEFEVFMENFKYFFDRWLEFKGIGNVALWDTYKVIVTLDRDMMINTTALIDDTIKLATLVSQETTDNYNPAVESHEVEQARRDAEEAANLEKAEKQNEMFAFQEAQRQAQLAAQQGQQGAASPETPIEEE